MDLEEKSREEAAALDPAGDGEQQPVPENPLEQGGLAHEEDPPRDPGHAGVPGARAQGVADVRFALGHGEGELRFNFAGDYMRAFCPVHGDCVRQRATREHAVAATPVAAGQGRPIGALYRWLLEARQHRTRAEHVAARTAGRALRAEARERFLLLEGAVDFSREYERPLRPGESEEPLAIR